MLTAPLLFLSILLVTPKLFKIKHLTSDLYIGLGGRYPKWSTLARSNSFVEKPSAETGKVTIMVADLANRVWDMDGGKKNLVFLPERKKKSQLFVIERSEHGWIRITNRGRCITYDKSDRRFERKKCKDEHIAQVFLMADEEGKVMSDEDIDKMEIGMETDPTISFGSSGNETMNRKIDGRADRSRALGAALESYMMAGGELGGPGALEAAAETYFERSGLTDTIGLNVVDELVSAAKAYLKRNAMIDASRMDGITTMEMLARVHPAAKRHRKTTNNVAQPIAAGQMPINTPHPGMGTSGASARNIDSFDSPYAALTCQLNKRSDRTPVSERLRLLMLYLGIGPNYNTNVPPQYAYPHHS